MTVNHAANHRHSCAKGRHSRVLRDNSVYIFVGGISVNVHVHA